MPGNTPFTIAETTRTYSPVDTLVLRTIDNSQTSILGAVFVSRRSQRAVYATTTRGPHTSLWRVATSGAMTEMARIDWEYEVRVTSAGDGSLRNGSQPTKRCSMLTFGGRMVRTEEFLHKGRGWFSGDSRTFNINNDEYKWKSRAENIGLSDGHHIGNRNMTHSEAVTIWRCVLTRRDSSIPSPEAAPRTSSSVNHLSGSSIPGTNAASVVSSEAVFSRAPPFPILTSSPSHVAHGGDNELQLPPSGIRTTVSPILSAPAPPTVLARFAPLQPGLLHGETPLFSPILDFSSDVGQNPHLLECLLLSAVILAATKGEWKQIQSAIDATSLQNIFVAEATGGVPPYTPGARQASLPAPPIIARNRTNAGRSRLSRDCLVEEEAQLSTDYLAESDRAPLLPRCNTHRPSRSSPFSFSPTSQSNIRTNVNCANGVYPSDPRHRTERPVISRRPVTAGSTPAGDGVFTRKKPSPRVTNAAQNPMGSRRQRPLSASGFPYRPISTPPPMYK